MFFSHTILARKNPLGTVWIAAHFEKKLKKPQIDKIDVATYAEFIMFPEAPMALRFAGQLLYGLVRIYELKVHYAFKDCQRLETDINATMKSLKLNLTPGADRFQIDAITLPDTFQLDAIDLHDSGFNFDEMNRHQKTFDQITITEFSPGQENYVSVQIEESDRNSFSTQFEHSNQGFGPMDEDTLPPFGGEMEERISPSKIPSQNPSNQIEIEIANLNLNSNQPEFNNENTSTRIDTEISNSNLNQPEPNNENSPVQNPIETDFSNSNPNFSREHSEPEITRAAEISAEIINNNSNNSNTNNNANGSKSTPNRRDSLSPLEPIHIEFSNANMINNNSNSPINFTSPQNPRFIMNPSSSHHQNEEVLPTRVPSPVRRNKRKRNQRKRESKDIFDEVLVLSNKEMKDQQKDASDLVCKRGKLAHKSVHIFRHENHLLKDQVFSKPPFNGMSKLLTETTYKNYPLMDPAEEMTWQPENATPGSIEIQRFNTTPQDVNNETINENSRSQSPNVNMDKSGGVKRVILPNEFRVQSPVGMTCQPEDVTPGGEMEVNEPRFTILESPIDNNNNNYDVNDSFNDNNISNNNSGLNFLETPKSVKAKRARIEEEADERGENLSFVDIEREENCWSARSMEMARFLRKMTPNSEINSHQINLNGILENKTRKESARMFFETLVLTSSDYISVKQEKPYGDILITPKPKLSAETQN